MKVQVKTLTQKSLCVDIDADKTVYDLKKELALYPDIGVNPEQQKLIYAGKILENEEKLSSCNIDEKKFLVVMIVKALAKAKEEEQATATDGAVATAATSASQSNTPATTTTSAPSPRAASPQQQQQSNPEQDEMVANIVSMGYPESDVRQALEASFNNPERAVEYLIEGIPMSPNIAGDDVVGGGGFIGDADSDAELPPFELLRSDPVFRNLRSLIQQNPELIDEAVSRIGEANPSVLTFINEHQQEFLDMLFEQSDDDDDDGQD